jgi:anaerobic selenocysteine-containing dehydrogenase
MRSEKRSTLKRVKTVCGMCSRQACGVEVVVQNGRVVEIKGNREFPTNKGALCIKGLAAKELLYDPHRLTQPLKTTAAGWKTISTTHTEISQLRDKLNTFAMAGLPKKRRSAVS